MERLDFDHSEIISYLKWEINTRIANKQLRTFLQDSFKKANLFIKDLIRTLFVSYVDSLIG